MKSHFLFRDGKELKTFEELKGWYLNKIKMMHKSITI